MDSLSITVNANNLPRMDHVVEIDLNLSLKDAAGLRLEEITPDHRVIDPSVPFQIDEQQPERYTLTFMMTGATASDTVRHYRFCLDAEAIVPQYKLPQVSVSEVYHQGQRGFLIQTASFTLVFHQDGGGFASLIDKDNHDWISYRPHGGSDGLYRGIPNIKHPDDYFHPGATNATTSLVFMGALKCRLHTWTLDGVCEALWDIYPRHMTFTLLKAPEVYWLLYEGTPGGTLDEANGLVGWSDGTRKSLGESWQTMLNPGWVYFGASNAARVLFFAQHKTEDKLSSYFPMEGNMTVFGFGRKDLEHYLTQVPAQFSFGLVDSHDHDEIASQVESIRHNVHVEVKPLVKLP